MNSYTPKPFDMIYPVALFGLGALCLARDAVVLGVMLWLLAWVIIVWIVIADVMAKRIEYLEAMSRALHSVSRVTDDRARSIGVDKIGLVESVRVQLDDKRDGMNTTRLFKLPIDGAKLLPFARGLLNGLPMSERQWSGLLSSSEIRTLRGVMRDRGLIAPVNDLDNRQGFKLTDEGRAFMESVSGVGGTI